MMCHTMAYGDYSASLDFRSHTYYLISFLHQINKVEEFHNRNALNSIRKWVYDT